MLELHQTWLQTFLRSVCRHQAIANLSEQYLPPGGRFLMPSLSAAALPPPSVKATSVSSDSMTLTVSLSSHSEVRAALILLQFLKFCSVFHGPPVFSVLLQLQYYIVVLSWQFDSHVKESHKYNVTQGEFKGNAPMCFLSFPFSYFLCQLAGSVSLVWMKRKPSDKFIFCCTSIHPETFPAFKGIAGFF